MQNTERREYHVVNVETIPYSSVVIILVNMGVVSTDIDFTMTDEKIYHAPALNATALLLSAL